jgi:hypothetical protein
VTSSICFLVMNSSSELFWLPSVIWSTILPSLHKIWSQSVHLCKKGPDWNTLRVFVNY